MISSHHGGSLVCRRWILSLVVAGLPGVADGRAQDVTIEYVAHAAFIVESSQGTRIALDPYNGNTWMGYHFPADLTADAVLISHPHFDHDASYNFDRSAVVFREAGTYTVGDVRLTGVASRHAGAARYEVRDIIPHNTIWIVDVDGIRIAHIGDNAPLDGNDLRALESVDILMVHPFFPLAEWQPVRDAIGAPVLIPMHYRIPSLTTQPPNLPTVAEWIGDGPTVVRHSGHRYSYRQSDLPGDREIHVLAPSPAVRPWPQAMREAWREAEMANGILADSTVSANEAVALYRNAVALAPDVITFHLGLGRALVAANRVDEAIRALETGLAGAATDDVTDTVRARGLVAELYRRIGRLDLAAIQYRAILRERQTYAADVQREARAFLHR